MAVTAWVAVLLCATAGLAWAGSVELTAANFDKEVLQHNGPVLVEVGGRWKKILGPWHRRRKEGDGETRRRGKGGDRGCLFGQHVKCRLVQSVGRAPWGLAKDEAMRKEK